MLCGTRPRRSIICASSASSGARLRGARSGAATVELSLLLPILLFLFFAGMDFSRVFCACVIVSNCARIRALYLSDQNLADTSPYATVEEAIAADSSDLGGSLQVTTLTGTDLQGYGWAEVTVVYPFQTVIAYPGIPSQVTISRTVRM